MTDSTPLPLVSVISIRERDSWLNVDQNVSLPPYKAILSFDGACFSILYKTKVNLPFFVIGTFERNKQNRPNFPYVYVAQNLIYLQ